jgi:membrane protein DedA with SNARE-associated domain
MTIPDWISLIVIKYGYAALLLATVVEGPVATIIGAFLASQGLLNIAFVYAVSVGGDLTGDLIYYGIGRSGRIAWRPRPSHGFKRRWFRVLTLARQLRTNAGRMLLFGKFTHSAGFLILLTAGAIRVPMTAFLGYNLLGTLPKSALFIVIGYYFCAAYNRLDSYLGVASPLIFIAICIGAGIWLRKRLFVQERSIPGQRNG